MRSVPEYELTEQTLLIDTQKLCEVLNCGKVSAQKIGDDANARFTIGRRVLWNYSKIKEYLNK